MVVGIRKTLRLGSAHHNTVRLILRPRPSGMLFRRNNLLSPSTLLRDVSLTRCVWHWQSDDPNLFAGAVTPSCSRASCAQMHSHRLSSAMRHVSMTGALVVRQSM